MHAVCHPCFFTWGDNGSPPYPESYPKMSADFPGEAQTFVEKVYDSAADAYEVGGYEPNTSRLTPDAELLILQELGRLTDQVVGDVFESFSKHPRRQPPAAEK